MKKNEKGEWIELAESDSKIETCSTDSKVEPVTILMKFCQCVMSGWLDISIGGWLLSLCKVPW